MRKGQKLDDWNRDRAAIGLPPIPSVEDIRDDTVSLLKNELGASWMVRCRDMGGPTVATLRKYDLKEVQRPQLPTIRMALRTVGYDIGVKRK